MCARHDSVVASIGGPLPRPDFCAETPEGHLLTGSAIWSAAALGRTPSKKVKMAMIAATRVQGGFATRSSSPGRSMRLTLRDTATAVKHTVPAFTSS